MDRPVSFCTTRSFFSSAGCEDFFSDFLDFFSAFFSPFSSFSTLFTCLFSSTPHTPPSHPPCRSLFKHTFSSFCFSSLTTLRMIGASSVFSLLYRSLSPPCPTNTPFHTVWSFFSIFPTTALTRLRPAEQLRSTRSSVSTGSFSSGSVITGDRQSANRVRPLAAINTLSL